MGKVKDVAISQDRSGRVKQARRGARLNGMLGDQARVQLVVERGQLVYGIAGGGSVKHLDQRV